MSAQRPMSVLLTMALAASSLLPQAPALRKSPELAITKPSGEEMLLSNFKGKVVVLELMFVNSAHCIRLAQTLNDLQGTLGTRGFQAVAVAFGPHADQALVGHVAERLQLTYPMGSATSEEVDAYLGRTGSEVLKIPQIVVIDRRGFIRASSGSKGDSSLEDEISLRALLDPLLNEKVASASVARATPDNKKVAQR
jgi:peroxiredoxin